MEHLEILNKIFDGLQDDETLSGISWTLENVDQSMASTIGKLCDDVMNYSNIDGKWSLYFGTSKVINYTPMCERFIDLFTYYLISLDRMDRLILLTHTDKRINDFSERLSVIEISLPVKVAISKKIASLQDSGVIRASSILNDDFFIELLSRTRFIVRTQVLNFLREELNSLRDKLQLVSLSSTEQKSKLIWKGSPSEFGKVFNELIEKGYIELPFKTSNKIKHYEKQAKLFMDFFSINTKVGTLEKELNPNLGGNSLTSDKANRFKIPFATGYTEQE